MSVLQKPLHFDDTRKSLVPILLYVATKMDMIFSAMKNSSDCLEAKEGCVKSNVDEGVYASTKKILCRNHVSLVTHFLELNLVTYRLCKAIFRL